MYNIVMSDKKIDTIVTCYKKMDITVMRDEKWSRDLQRIENGHHSHE